MKYILPDKEHPCTVYNNHIHMIKMNIKKYEDKFGYCDRNMLHRIMHFECKEVQSYIMQYNHTDYEQLDSLKNIIDDLRLYLRR
ncbi:MAG: hypothetical protein CMC93_06145 [Flavobacteriaceae bacterium]|nr:hypothetical protein [Flavobacteriaceae bacterium]